MYLSFVTMLFFGAFFFSVCFSLLSFILSWLAAFFPFPIFSFNPSSAEWLCGVLIELYALPVDPVHWLFEWCTALHFLHQGVRPVSDTSAPGSCACSTAAGASADQLAPTHKSGKLTDKKAVILLSIVEQRSVELLGAAAALSTRLLPTLPQRSSH